MNTVTFIILLAIEIGCGIIMKSIAEKRGANKTAWFITDLIIRPFVFIFIPLIKNKK